MKEVKSKRQRLAVEYRLDAYRQAVKIKAAEENMTISDLYKIALGVAYRDMTAITEKEINA